MVKFHFFVRCDGWRDGGYENASFAETEKAAIATVNRWNAARDQLAARLGHAVDGYVKLLSVQEITDAEFAADYIY